MLAVGEKDHRLFSRTSYAVVFPIYAFKLDIDIFHFDLYRLTDEDDLYSTGFYDYIEQGGLTVTEWTELFESAIPSDALRLRIEPIDETTRRFTLC